MRWQQEMDETVPCDQLPVPMAAALEAACSLPTLLCILRQGSVWTGRLFDWPRAGGEGPHWPLPATVQVRQSHRLFGTACAAWQQYPCALGTWNMLDRHAQSPCAVFVPCYCREPMGQCAGQVKAALLAATDAALLSLPNPGRHDHPSTEDPQNPTALGCPTWLRQSILARAQACIRGWHADTLRQLAALLEAESLCPAGERFEQLKLQLAGLLQTPAPAGGEANDAPEAPAAGGSKHEPVPAGQQLQARLRRLRVESFVGDPFKLKQACPISAPDVTICKHHPRPSLAGHRRKPSGRLPTPAG